MAIMGSINEHMICLSSCVLYISGGMKINLMGMKYPSWNIRRWVNMMSPSTYFKRHLRTKTTWLMFNNSAKAVYNPESYCTFPHFIRGKRSRPWSYRARSLASCYWTFISLSYRRGQIQLRIALVFLSACLSSAVSGLLSNQITQMHGIWNLEGWSWVFLVRRRSQHFLNHAESDMPAC